MRWSALECAQVRWSWAQFGHKRRGNISPLRHRSPPSWVPAPGHNLPKEQYVGGLADRVNSQVQILNRALPKPLAVDPKSRTILPDTITQAEQDAFTRHKVDPEQALALKRKGQLPPALMNELRTLNTLREWSGFQAE